MKEILNKIKKNFNLTEDQEKKILKFSEFLNEENKNYNLTGFKNLEDILVGNIEDSLNGSLSESILESEKILDIGTGCGVPGIVLAVKYPDKKFYLMEVIKKRINFLKKALDLLEIKNCEIINLDYKTFIRSSKIEIDCFITRATLSLKDLFFIFSKSSDYKNKKLVYWGSKNWKENFTAKNSKLISFNEKEYLLSSKKRFIINFKLKK